MNAFGDIYIIWIYNDISCECFSQSAQWDVATINRGIINIGIAHGIRKNCSFIKANTLVGISYVWSLMGHASDAGFTIKETREFIDNDAEKEILRSRVN